MSSDTPTTHEETWCSATADVIRNTISRFHTSTSPYIRMAINDVTSISELIKLVSTECPNGAESPDALRDMAKVVHSYTTRFPLATYIAGGMLLSAIDWTQRHLRLTTPLAVFGYGIAYSRGMLIATERADSIVEFLTHLQTNPVYIRDYDYLAASSMYSMYLWRNRSGVVFELPTNMYARVAIALTDVRASAREIRYTYDLLVKGVISVATPILRNACARDGQHASCFLQVPRDDTIHGIFETVRDTAMLSRGGGGIGIDLSTIRSHGERSDGVMCAGITLPATLLNTTARYVSQGSRPGAVATYLNVDHPEVLKMLDLRNPATTDGLRHIETGVTISDEFMKRVRAQDDWYFFCPHECPELRAVSGEEYSRVYNRLIEERRYVSRMPAFDLLKRITRSQLETGMPYVIFIDRANAMNNQSNIGLIRHANLCTEITQVAKPNVITSCVLSAVNIVSFIENAFSSDENTPARLRVDQLDDAVRVIVRMLNTSYDTSRHPVPGMEDTSRPLGIGIIGLADALAMLNMTFGSDDAQQLSSIIAQVMYCAAVQESATIARLQNFTYPDFEGSPLSRGELHCDMYDRLTGEESTKKTPPLATIRYLGGVGGSVANIELTRAMGRTGVANSLFIALMPTRSTSEVMGVSDGFAPFQPLIHKRNAVAGTRTSINRTLLDAMVYHRIDPTPVIDHITMNRGSVATCEHMPIQLRESFKTAWEIPVEKQIDMAAVRVPFVCQSQSLSYYIENADQRKLMRALMHAWERYLPTGMYYLHQRAMVDPIRVPLPPRARSDETPAASCSIDNPGCTSCAL